MEEKRRKKGEHTNGNFTIRINEYEYDQIQRLRRLTRLPAGKAILFAVNQYLGDYEINGKDPTF